MVIVCESALLSRNIVPLLSDSYACNGLCICDKRRLEDWQGPETCLATGLKTQISGQSTYKCVYVWVRRRYLAITVREYITQIKNVNVFTS